MFELDVKSRKAISDQIIDNMKELIISGVLPPESRIASVRELAGQLLVNPNTVQKAYRTLESQGYIYTVKGRGTFVADTSSLSPDRKQLQEAQAQLRDSISRLYHLGLSKEAAKELTDRIFDERSDWT
ncbi:MAG: GntR family transcriptional regulator [Firmicutes bacterium]|nr:GntR family transcriptional regulator [Bacillota bacterium]